MLTSTSTAASGAERQETLRRRRREGVLLLVQVEMKPEDIQALIDGGYLAEDDATDPRLVSAAVKLAAKI